MSANGFSNYCFSSVRTAQTHRTLNKIVQANANSWSSSVTVMDGCEPLACCNYTCFIMKQHGLCVCWGADVISMAQMSSLTTVTWCLLSLLTLASTLHTPCVPWDLRCDGAKLCSQQTKSHISLTSYVILVYRHVLIIDYPIYHQ